ncbi:MAG: hypothetical protein MUE32_08670 [Bacteroidales bacterium]|jgi:hypothetical protein|nr:hypothetical protein [Bacteroidales bacterium]
MNTLNKSVLLTVLWLPRILIILLALFTVLFTFDAFDGDEPILKKILGWLIHLLPTAVLAAIAYLSWNWPWTGALSLSGLAAVYFFTYAQRTNNHIIDIALLAAGLLFLLSWLLRGKIAVAREEKNR